MVAEIRVYVEGGGDSANGRAFLRAGFSSFFRDLVSSARKQHVRWQIIVCGPRNAAFDAFRTSLRQNPLAFNVLLVDSEAAVSTAPWAHLKARDGWEIGGLSDDNCHLMTQAMEAWFLADVHSLALFYGADFYRGSIPSASDVEKIPKSTLEPSLKAATRNTQKGEYHKIHHGSQLLARINPALVRTASHHCERMFGVLESKMS
jgi:hypothetical protein